MLGYPGLEFPNPPLCSTLIHLQASMDLMFFISDKLGHLDQALIARFAWTRADEVLARPLKNAEYVGKGCG